MSKQGRSVIRPWSKPKLVRRKKPDNMGFYNSKAWRDTSAIVLRDEPLCRECLKHGKTKSSRIADHIVPINEGGELLHMDNLQALCWSCHSKKTNKDNNGSFSRSRYGRDSQ